MNNKVLVELLVPDAEEVYSVFLPINKKIGNIIVLLNKVIREKTNNPELFKSNKNVLYNRETGERYAPNNILKDTNIRNGTKLIIM